MSEKTLLKINKLFKCPPHPFNMEAAGDLSYAEWEFQRAPQTLALFEPEFSPEEILGTAQKGGQAAIRPARVLDIGCGAGGKSVYYASLGAQVIGIDLVEDYRSKAEAFADSKGVLAGAGAFEPSTHGSFRFICGDAAHTGLPDAGFDTIIMNDAMEHVSDPEGVLAECARLLKPGGRLFINFPPYGHPYGAHVSDLLGVPWAQLFFSDEDIAAAYSTLAKGLPDGENRVNFRVSYINKMTLRRFKSLIGIGGKGVPTKTAQNTKCNHTECSDIDAGHAGNPNSLPFQLLLYREVPLRGWLTPLAKLPLTKEYFVRMAVAVLQKT